MEAREFTLAVLLLAIIVLLSVTTKGFCQSGKRQSAASGNDVRPDYSRTNGHIADCGKYRLLCRLHNGAGQRARRHDYQRNGNAVAGIVAALLIGAVLGIINAVMICHLHPLVATLGTWMAYKDCKR